tara:strand:- start:6364 stop:6603 length:240 start_codon:yes stop_codon:yes gene_type:complete
MSNVNVKKGKSKAEAPSESKQIIITTLNIKEGDMIATNRGWKKAKTDAYLNKEGIICVEIKTFGVWKWMSHDQSITVIR